MRVEVWFQKSSVPIIYKEVEATYQKGDFLCVSFWDGSTGGKAVDKYPVQHLYKFRESLYSTSQPCILGEKDGS